MTMTGEIHSFGNWLHLPSRADSCRWRKLCISDWVHDIDLFVLVVSLFVYLFVCAFACRVQIPLEQNDVLSSSSSNTSKNGPIISGRPPRLFFWRRPPVK